MASTKDIDYDIVPLRPSRKWQTWKLALRSIATFFIGIAIIIFLVLGFQGRMYSNYYISWDFLTLPIV